MIYGYVKLDGKWYFCGMGNTKRTANAVCEGNARELEKVIARNIPVHYTSTKKENIGDITSLLEEAEFRASMDKELFWGEIGEDL